MATDNPGGKGCCDEVSICLMFTARFTKNDSEGRPSSARASLNRSLLALKGGFGLLVLGLVAAGMVVSFFAPAEAKRLKVVTTIRPLYAFTAQVAGQAADVENLLPPGVGPHDYAITPTDAVRLHKADVLIINGLGLEEWLKGLLGTVRQPGLAIVEASRGIELLPLPEAGHHEKTRHREGLWDPHVWLDPLRAAQQVENIRDGLAAADPSNKETYEENARRAVERLQSLDAEIKEATAGFKRREVLTFHAAFQYFARRYGLEVVAVVEPAPGKEPTPKFLAYLYDVVRRHHLSVIYTEPQFRPRVAEVLARDLGLEIAVLDPGVTGALGPEAYETFMRNNVSVLSRYQGR